MAVLRPAGPADAAAILALVRGLAAYEKLADAVVATQDDLAAALFGPQPRVFCDLAEVDGAPVGMALWFYTFSTFRGRHGIWLEDLFVDPAHRGRGIGGALLAGLAARCAGEGLARQEWAVLDWNAPAIAFYEAQGARLLPDWRLCRLDGPALSLLGRPRSTA